ncbi:MAG: hypothetical protein FWF15_07415 [Oscillospiraceae bacterium]|nr:hypothetical protein [Oscillospiraceae bacterium]
MEKRIHRYFIFYAAGFIIFTLGTVAAVIYEIFAGISIPFQIVIGICYVLGLIFFIVGRIYDFFKLNQIMKNQDSSKQYIIDKFDERNVSIRTKAKAKVFNLFAFNVFPVLAILMYFMNTLALFFILNTYMAFIFTYYFYLTKFQKQL